MHSLSSLCKLLSYLEVHLYTKQVAYKPNQKRIRMEGNWFVCLQPCLVFIWHDLILSGCWSHWQRAWFTLTLPLQLPTLWLEKNLNECFLIIKIINTIWKREYILSTPIHLKNDFPWWISEAMLGSFLTGVSRGCRWGNRLWPLIPCSTCCHWESFGPGACDFMQMITAAQMFILTRLYW